MKQAGGFVYLVGAGPGNPDLITVKGRRCVRRSAVIIHDRLIDPKILEESTPGTLLIDAGKRFGHEDQQQAEIHELMIAYAKQDLVVCRLKGGDPFIFGRGGEEVAVLKAAGIPYEVVPGVSSINAAPAMAGIPLTHRDCAHGFLVVTGSRSVDFSTAEWQAAEALLKAGGTVVVFMGLARLKAIRDNLVNRGCPAGLPAAVISRTTWPDQEVRFGRLENIHESAEGMRTPSLLVLGKVVGLADALEAEF